MRKQSIKFKKSDFSTRLPYQTDAQGNSMEGGALNAGYDLVEAVAKISANLGRHGFEYGKDFEWTDQGYDDNMNDTVDFSISKDKYQEAMVIMKLKK